MRSNIKIYSIVFYLVASLLILKISFAQYYDINSFKKIDYKSNEKLLIKNLSERLENVPGGTEDDSSIANFHDICWSPDNKSLYFSAMRCRPDYSDYKPEKWNVYKYDFETKSVALFIDSALYIAVSASGKQIATGIMHNGNRDIYIYDNSGKIINKITSHPADDYAASFSPDEKKIAFNSKRDEKTDIYVMDIDTKELNRLTMNRAEGGNDNPQWSPDGKKIVFYYGTTNGRDQIYIMDSDGSNQKNITNDTLLNYYPGWIDQNGIIYTQNNKNGVEEIYTMSPDGSKMESLLHIRSFYARISPNKEMIAYVNEKDQCITVISKTGEFIRNIILP